MKNKIGAIMLAGSMLCTVAIGFTGCIGEGTINNSGSSTDDLANVTLATSGGFKMPEGGFDIEKPVTISFYHTMGKVLKEKLDYQLELFKELFPNITVVDAKYGNYDDVHTQIGQEITAGNQPNIAYCYGDHVADYNVSNSVLAINDFLPGGTYADEKITLANGDEYNLGLTVEEKNMFVENFYNEGHMFGDGKMMYMLPFAKSTEVMFYNKNFFNDNKLKVPTTWDELWETCERILEIDPDCIPFGYDSEANWFITMCEQYDSAYTYPTGTAANRFRFDNEKNRSFVGKLAENFQKGYFTTQEMNSGTYTSSLFTSLTEPKCYMCVGSTAGGQYQKPQLVNGQYAFEAGIAQIPQIDPDHPKAISQGPSVCIFKSDDPQEVLASWLLVKYLTTNIEFQADFSIDSGYMPPLKMEYMMTLDSYKNELEENANGTTGLAALSAKMCLEQKDAYFTSPAFVGSSRARTEVGALLQAVFSNTSIDSAFQTAVRNCIESIT